MTPLQEDVLSLIRRELTWTFFLLPGEQSEVAVPIEVRGPQYVAIGVRINGHKYVNASIRESILPDVAFTVARCLAMIEWDDPVSVECETADGVTHILKTIGGRSRPATAAKGA